MIEDAHVIVIANMSMLNRFKSCGEHCPLRNTAVVLFGFPARPLGARNGVGVPW